MLGFGAVSELPLSTLPSAGGGGTAYSLICSPGSYAYSGKTATLTQGIKLAVAAGSYAYSGKTTTLTQGLKLPVSAGSYAYSGKTSTLVVGYKLAISAGSYTYTGSQATLTASGLIAYSLAINPGAYAYAGTTTLLPIGVKVTNSAGAYAYAGQSTTFVRQVVLPVSPGAYAYAGSQADLTASGAIAYSLDVGAGSYAYSGNSATFSGSGLSPEHFSGGYRTKLDYWPKKRFPSKADIKRQRQLLGILPKDEIVQIVVDAVAERQLEEISLTDQQKIDELSQELELHGITLEARYAEMLANQREYLISNEIKRIFERVQQVEEMEMITLIAALL